MKGLSEYPKIERDAFDFVIACFDSERPYHCLWGAAPNVRNTDNGLISLSFMDLGSDKEIEILYDPERIARLMVGERPHTSLRNYAMSQLYNALLEE